MVSSSKGKHFARIVKWRDEKGQHVGIVESQAGNLLGIYVFDKNKFGNRRTSLKMEDIEFF